MQEPGTMDSVRSGPFGQIFRPDNFIFGQVSPTLAALLAFRQTIALWADERRTAVSACMSDKVVLCRPAQATTGPKAITQRVPS